MTSLTIFTAAPETWGRIRGGPAAERICAGTIGNDHAGAAACARCARRAGAAGVPDQERDRARAATAAGRIHLVAGGGQGRTGGRRRSEDTDGPRLSRGDRKSTRLNSSH